VHRLLRGVDASGVLLADDQIEIPRRILAVDIYHALQRGDGDKLFILEAAVGPQHIAGIIRKMLRKSVFGLLGKRYPVHQEQHACNSVGLKHALHECGRRAGFTGSGGHLYRGAVRGRARSGRVRYLIFCHKKRLTGRFRGLKTLFLH